MKSEGRRIHGLAAHQREAGNHLEALKLYDEAILAYQKDSDILGLAEVFADRAIIYRHLFDQTDDKNFLIIAKHEMMASLEMVEKSGNKSALAIPYFQLANVQRELGELTDAKNSYQKAIENQTDNPALEHNRPAVLADMKAHLATIEYQLGDKAALERALTTLSELEQTDEAKYNKDVWLSGGYMKLAEAIKEDDLKKAQEYLNKAKEIIDANPDLKLRKEQWAKLATTFPD